MATTDTASIISLHQPRKAKTGAERARAYRERKRAAGTALTVRPVDVPAVTVLTPLPPPTVTLRAVTPSRSLSSVALLLAAFALAVVGITINGWFARSLGATETAGYLFLAIGVAADLVALAMPSCAARLWLARHRAAALVGWGVWLMTFAFAVMAGVGFASVNIADVTLARASRVTPAVTMAETALSDAMAARDRECKGGVGRFCREREAEVAARRQALDGAGAKVEQTADPQTDAVMRAVIWLSGGMLAPTRDDFGMLRLVLLALLPQIGGVLLMLSSPRRAFT